MKPETFRRSLLWLALVLAFLSGLVLGGVAHAQGIHDPPKTGTPWWATSLAVAGPLADGMTTVYAIHASGPYARVAEGNPIFSKLFGSDVTPGEIMAFKVGQAALMGTLVHYQGKSNRKAAIATAVITAGINFTVSALNYRNGQRARRLNGGAP